MIPYDQIYAYYVMVDTPQLPPRLNFDSWEEVYNHTFKTYILLRRHKLLLPHEATKMVTNMMKHRSARLTMNNR